MALIQLLPNLKMLDAAIENVVKHLVEHGDYGYDREDALEAVDDALTNTILDRLAAEEGDAHLQMPLPLGENETLRL